MSKQAAPFGTCAVLLLVNTGWVLAQDVAVFQQPLTVSEAEVILGINLEIGETNDWRPESFKPEVRLELVRKLRDQLQALGINSAKKAEAAELWTGNAVSLLSEKDRAMIDEAKQALMQRAVTIILPEEAIELSWTFGQMRWHVRHVLIERLRLDPKFLAAASEEDLLLWGEDALKHLAMHRLNLAVLKQVL